MRVALLARGERLAPRSLALLESLVDDVERARVRAFRRWQDAQDALLGAALAKSMIARALGGRPREVRVVRGAHGKPRLDPTPATPLEFNVSHGGGFVGCAIARGRVGLDLEAIDRRVDDSVVEGLFAAEERAQIERRTAGDRDGMVLTLWTLREAYSKAIGEGLGAAHDGFWIALDAASPRLCLRADARAGARFRLWTRAFDAALRVSTCLEAGEVERGEGEGDGVAIEWRTPAELIEAIDA